MPTTFRDRFWASGAPFGILAAVVILAGLPLGPRGSAARAHGSSPVDVSRGALSPHPGAERVEAADVRSREARAARPWGAGNSWRTCSAWLAGAAASHHSRNDGEWAERWRYSPGGENERNVGVTLRHEYGGLAGGVVRAVVSRVFVGWAKAGTGSGVWEAAQLPPEIQMDRFLLQAERALEAGDASAARAALERLLALQEEHGIEPPPEDHFRYGKVWQAVGEPARAGNAITRYLKLLGRDAERYGEALDLLIRVEAEAAFEAFRENPVDARGMEFVWVPPGEFRMGSTSSEAYIDEQPVTQVRISRGFWLGKYEVTQSEWHGVMGSNPSRNSGCGRCPVDQVSWEDARDFIRRLNRREGREVYRLPTEAEWEYAARAGATEDRYGDPDAIAWHAGNSGERTHPVGEKAPNAWGLHDMLGNLYEWVHGRTGRYPGGTVTDPREPGSGPFRVIRGGGWFCDARCVRAPARSHSSLGSRTYGVGFRLLRTAP